MKTDPAIECIRATRHKISAKYAHNTRALIAHYQATESKYRKRLIKESTINYNMK